jgi:hypothetical protein
MYRELNAKAPLNVPALQVSPITMLHSEYEHKQRRQIAVNQDYICYGLKQGHIRVLCRASADRALCKGHGEALSDMRCASLLGLPWEVEGSAGRLAGWQGGGEMAGSWAAHWARGFSPAVCQGNTGWRRLGLAGAWQSQVKASGGCQARQSGWLMGAPPRDHGSPAALRGRPAWLWWEACRE